MYVENVLSVDCTELKASKFEAFQVRKNFEHSGGAGCLDSTRMIRVRFHFELYEGGMQAHGNISEQSVDSVCVMHNESSPSGI